ncbi:MAG: nucleotidyltransferase family protein [bacterium]
MKHIDTNQFLVKPMMTIKEVVAVIDRFKEGIAMVVDEEGRLVGTITDGDIRRFMLTQRSLDETCDRVMCKRPTTAHENSSYDEIRHILIQQRLRNVPLVDDAGKVKGLISLRDLIEEKHDKTVAIIMAGGEGKRLRPITKNVPKPMVEVGGKPVIESIINILASFDITTVVLSVNYKAEIIEEYFGDGSRFGVEISYLREKKKLGTIGSLSLLKDIPHSPFLVLNGDVITNINFTQFLDFHRRHRSVLTIAASQYHLSIPYGVLDLVGHFVLNIKEKPMLHLFCNAGMYVLEPDIVSLIPKSTNFDMTTLITELITQGLPVTAFPIREYWVDIGSKNDLQRVQDDIQDNNPTNI